MSRHLDRLHRGERWWAAEIALRLLGALLLAASYRLAELARHAAQAAAGHIALCAAIFLTLSGGLALALFGPGLFERLPIPPRSAWMRRKR